ncbi:MAG TPA: TAXI family TRAP transporter solute-binding subunit [Burkholderiales bacterium]
MDTEQEQTTAPPPAASSAAVRKRRLEAFRHRPTPRELLTIWLPTLALVIAAFWTTYHFIQPAPPDHLTITTGAADGAYYQYAVRYREILARDGVRLDIRTSSGSVENLARLAKDPAEDNSGVEAAFVQGGLGPMSRNIPLADPAAADDGPRPHSLGTVAYEALWVFTRGRKEPTRLTDLRNARLAIGPEGSGSRKVALDLLAAHGIPAASATLSPLSGRTAIDALKGGELDAIFLIAAPDAPVVRELAALPDVHPMSFANAAAIAKRFPYLTAVTLTQGVFDLQADLPPHDVQLVATRANLVVRADLHPALAYLLMEAASEVHSGAGLFHRAGEFPAAVGTDFPLATQAESYYKNGRPFLQRYLPYWLANLVQRMLLFLVPIFGVLIPVMKLLPVIVNWRRQQRINRWYGELKFLELDLDARQLTREQLDRYLKRLAEIDQAARHMRMPLDFSDRVYTLRQHIAFVQERLAALPGAPTEKTA